MSERSLFRKVSKEEKQAILRRFDVRNAKQVGVKFIIDIPVYSVRSIYTIVAPVLHFLAIPGFALSGKIILQMSCPI